MVGLLDVSNPNNTSNATYLGYLTWIERGKGTELVERGEILWIVGGTRLRLNLSKLRCYKAVLIPI